MRGVTEIVVLRQPVWVMSRSAPPYAVNASVSSSGAVNLNWMLGSVNGAALQILPLCWFRAAALSYRAVKIYRAASLWMSSLILSVKQLVRPWNSAQKLREACPALSAVRGSSRAPQPYPTLEDVCSPVLKKRIVIQSVEQNASCPASAGWWIIP